MASSHIRRVFTLALLVLAVCGTTAFAQLPSARLLSVYPPGGARGSTVEVEVHGDDLEPADGLLFSHSGIRATHVIDETNPFLRDRAIPNRFRVEIAPDVPTGRYDVRVAGRFGVSNPRTFVVSNVAESVESEPNDAREQATALAVGSIANGRSNARADLDWWRIEGRPSERVFIRCESRDLDSRMEAILTYFDAEGREIARARETAARPAELDVVLSGEGHGYVRVNDAVYDGSGHHVYRLVVTAGPVIDAVLPPAIVAGREARVTILGRGLEGGTPAESLRLGEHPLEKLEVTIAAPASAPGGEPPGPRGFDRPEQLRLRAFPWWLEASEGAFSEP
ncbi:MAG TPA: hypothetical protein VK116_20480, partial [Planctomycetota bacterium]|nr:hypothetical protein [Planctomycetota bacterium]